MLQTHLSLGFFSELLSAHHHHSNRISTPLATPVFSLYTFLSAYDVCCIYSAGIKPCGKMILIISAVIPVRTF